MRRRGLYHGQRTVLIASFILVIFLSGSHGFLSGATLSGPQDELKKIYSSFLLEEKWRIDTSTKELIDRGLFDIYRFVVGADGSVYILNSKNKGDLIFAIDKTGKLLRSFARQGQGPGELERPAEMFLTSDGNIFVLDPSRGKMAIFNPEGL